MKLSVFRNEIKLNSLVLDQVINDQGHIDFHIGRSSECYLTLDDQSVSREHGLLRKTNKGWEIKKVSEFGNILLNGSSCEHAEVAQGDKIAIGPFTIIIDELEEKAHQETLVREMNLENDIDQELSEKEEPKKIQENYNTESFQVEMPEEQDDQAEADQALDQNQEDDREALDFDDDQSEPLSLEVEDSKVYSNQAQDNDEQSEKDEGEEPPEESSVKVEETGSFNNMSEFNETGDQSLHDNSFSLDDSHTKTKVDSAFLKFELKISGEYAPYDQYFLENEEIIIGRNEKTCKIILQDPEVSQEHARLIRKKSLYILEDLNSSNGTIFQGKRINRTELVEDDEFIIGSTSFTLKSVSALLEEEVGRLMPVDQNQEVTVKEIVEVGANFDTSGIDFSHSEVESEKSKSLFSKEKLKDPAYRRKLIYFAVILVIILTWETDPGPTSANKARPAPKVSSTEKTKKALPEKKPTRTLSKEQEEIANNLYKLSRDLIDKGRYQEALFKLEELSQLSPIYKESISLQDIAKQGLAQLEEAERIRRETEEKIQREKRVKELLSKARESISNKKMDLGQSYLSQVLEIDPESLEVPSLKIEIEAWKKSQEKLALEKAQKKAERERQVALFNPGKNFFLKKEWHKANFKLADFLKDPGLDDDLVSEATQMLKSSQDNLAQEIDPLLEKARSLMEGQDLKGAHEAYSSILKIDPTHEESLNGVSKISETLTSRAKKIFREAMISESLNLFDDAKEKYQEVKQIAPVENEYFKKAELRLKDYLE